MQPASNRENGGRQIRELWVEYSKRFPDTKPHHLIGWDALDERNKEADRFIWEHITAPYLEDIEILRKSRNGLQRDMDEALLEIAKYKLYIHLTRDKGETHAEPEDSH